jgi:hypothetical protein
VVQEETQDLSELVQMPEHHYNLINGNPGPITSSMPALSLSQQKQLPHYQPPVGQQHHN